MRSGTGRVESPNGPSLRLARLPAVCSHVSPFLPLCPHPSLHVPLTAHRQGQVFYETWTCEERSASSPWHLTLRQGSCDGRILFETQGKSGECHPGGVNSFITDCSA